MTKMPDGTESGVGSDNATDQSNLASATGASDVAEWQAVFAAAAESGLRGPIATAAAPAPSPLDTGAGSGPAANTANTAAFPFTDVLAPPAAGMTAAWDSPGAGAALGPLSGAALGGDASMSGASPVGAASTLFGVNDPGAGGGATTQTVTFSGSGIVFNNTYQSSVSAQYKSAILSAEQTIAGLWTNNITINETFQAANDGTNSFLASNNFSLVGVSYTQLKNALQGTSNDSSIALAAYDSLPASNPASGNPTYSLPGAYANFLGLSSGSFTDTVTLNTSYNWKFGQDVINAITHEITEGGMGRVGGLGVGLSGRWSTTDLFSYNAAGQRDLSSTDNSRFFSYNGGQTTSQSAGLSYFAANSGNDAADFQQLDVFGTGSPGETNTLSTTDIQEMEALGWTPAQPPPVWSVPNLVMSAFGSNPSEGWVSQDQYPRALADVNGDGKDDIVGFGSAGMYESLATGNGQFAAPTLVLSAFGANPSSGWTSQNLYPRQLADVNGDGKADVVGFGSQGVYVGLATGGGNFGAPFLALSALGSDPNTGGGWTSQDQYPRLMGDVTGDGRADIVAFGAQGVYEATANANGTFHAPSLVLSAFGSDPSAGGWTSQNLYPFALADVNGATLNAHPLDDIVAFASNGVYVALADANGDGKFQAPFLALSGFGTNQGWTSQDGFPRELADVNGDGRADIVGFGSSGAWLAEGNADGTFSAPVLALDQFGSNASAGGWTSFDAYPRLVGDVTGDHHADLVGFASSGTYVAIAG
jgi:hypothetical protein